MAVARTQDREFLGLRPVQTSSAQLRQRPWIGSSDPGDHAQPNGTSDRGATIEAGMSSVVIGPPRAAVCHINHATSLSLPVAGASRAPVRADDDRAGPSAGMKMGGRPLVRDLGHPLGAFR
jgi:hypothetical protein